MSDRLYFTTDHDGVHIEEMALVYGMQRLPGETDGQLRARVQRTIGATRRGTREEIVEQVEGMPGVSRCNVVEERSFGTDDRVVIDVTLEAWCRGQYEEDLQRELHLTLQSMMTLGVTWVLAIEHEPARFGEAEF